MAAYADAHGLSFSLVKAAPLHAGTPLSYGKQLGVFNVMGSTSGRPMEFGNFSYAWPLYGEDALCRSWDFAYLAIKLDRSLPHVSLQAKQSVVLWDLSAGIPVGPSQDQRLELEGDFRKYFYFYCPSGYETDALYMFTPDVMALFIDEVKSFDAEIIDDWMMVYSSFPFVAGDTATYDRLLRIADLVGSKVAHQTDGYRDERVGDFAANRVTPRGLRLRRVVPWQVPATVGGVLIAMFVSFGLAVVGVLALMLFMFGTAMEQFPP